jgi:hypothetical protein
MFGINRTNTSATTSDLALLRYGATDNKQVGRKTIGTVKHTQQPIAHAVCGQKQCWRDRNSHWQSRPSSRRPRPVPCSTPPSSVPCSTAAPQVYTTRVGHVAVVPTWSGHAHGIEIIVPRLCGMNGPSSGALSRPPASANTAAMYDSDIVAAVAITITSCCRLQQWPLCQST